MNTNIKNSTKPQELYGVDTKENFINIINIANESGDYDDVYEAIIDDVLAERLERHQIENGEAIDPTVALQLAEERLAEMLKPEKVAADTKPSTIESKGEFAFAEEQNSPKEESSVFVISSIRPYGPVRTARTGKKTKYRSLNCGGYYLDQTPEGEIKLSPGNVLSNSALFGKIVEFDDITSDEEITLEAELAFNVINEQRIAHETTYFETSPAAIAAAKKERVSVTRNSQGILGVNCYHKVTTKAFKRLGSKVMSKHLNMLEEQMQRTREAKLGAMEETAKERALSSINLEKEVNLEKARGEAKGIEVSSKIKAISDNAEALKELGVDMQSVILAALGGK